MPSAILGFISGNGTNILSGNYWSGQGAIHPVGGIQLIMAPTNSGIVYVALSGAILQNSGGRGVTINSGVSQLSGGLASGLGTMDGMPIGPGVPYFIPKLAFNPNSGVPQVWCQPDAACSGQARVNWEIF